MEKQRLTLLHASYEYIKKNGEEGIIYWQATKRVQTCEAHNHSPKKDDKATTTKK